MFLPGIHDEALICEFVEALHFPLNILIGQGMPTLSRLQELGVARVSTGSGIARAAIGLTRRIALEIKQSGSLDSMFDGAISYPDANALFER